MSMKSVHFAPQNNQPQTTTTYEPAMSYSQNLAPDINSKYTTYQSTYGVPPDVRTGEIFERYNSSLAAHGADMRASQQQQQHQHMNGGDVPAQQTAMTNWQMDSNMSRGPELYKDVRQSGKCR